MNSPLNALRQTIKTNFLKRIAPTGFYFSQAGYCPCCERDTSFEARDPWLRDSFFCNSCGCIPRERALMAVIEREYPQWRNLYIHESSPGDRGASPKLKAQGQHYVASQFYPFLPFGTVINGFQNQNLEAQIFPSAYFDLVITQDVLEHIYHPEKAFAEIARTLKPGGAHILTVPLINKHKPTQRWATLGPNGKPNFLFTPEHHGNPVDPEGSPVTFHWGFDIVDFIKKHSGLDTTIEHLDDLSQGIRAEYIEVLICRKPA